VYKMSGKMNRKINYYEILGVNIESTEKEILRAYRKKALTCHPDKNPDNPKAAELFIELNDAFKVLTDKEARAACDKLLRAKEAAKLRTQAFDAKRKKFKDDLDQRESAAQFERDNDEINNEKLEERIRRLREEGSKLLREQQELLEKQIAEEKKNQDNLVTPKLKVKWKSSKSDHQNGGYNDANLKEIFEKYGELNTVLVSPKKNGLAIVEYLSYLTANMALEFERGFVDNPLIITWLEGAKPKIPTTAPPTTTSAAQTVEKLPEVIINDNDFENLVLMRMRQAEERKRLTKEILVKEEDEKN